MQSVKSLENIKWMLDPEIAHFNHGSFGARPVEVFEAQIALKRQFESSPTQFLDREGKERVSQARNTISHFLGSSDEQLGFVENASTGIACVLQSLRLKPGAEIVTSSHVYNGVRQLLRFYSHKNGCLYREIKISTPLRTKDEIVQSLLCGFSKKTQLLVIDHVASITGIVFPIKEIIDACKQRGIAVLVDGAHAPGMIDLTLDELSPDWYVGNLHKWVCGPPGAGFIWVNKEYLDCTHPMTVSHFYQQGFTNEFDWQGTRDITSILGAAIAIDWGHSIGWDTIRSHNHSLSVAMHRQLVEAWGVLPMSPVDGTLMGSMGMVKLPQYFSPDEQELNEIRLRIYQKHKIEVPLLLWQGDAVVRVSSQLYIKKEHFDGLLAVLSEKQTALPS